jgi:hypothetical protein
MIVEPLVDPPRGVHIPFAIAEAGPAASDNAASLPYRHKKIVGSRLRISGKGKEQQGKNEHNNALFHFNPPVAKLNHCAFPGSPSKDNAQSFSGFDPRTIGGIQLQ